MAQDFDIEAYLARIAYDGPRAPDLATLRALHRRHPAAIPFENLDPLLERPVALDIEALQAKLVRARRGGYCFEENALFAAALEALGFAVTRLAARVRWGRPREAPEGPRSHMLLRVDLAEGPYLADVGFGGHLFAAPLALASGIEQEAPASTLRLADADGSYTLQALLPAGFQDLYRFTLEPQAAADYEVANWFTSTHPASLFRGNLLAERLTEAARYSLFNTQLTERRRGGETLVRTLASARELGDVLEAAFALSPPAAAGEIWARLPKE
jgi:N-hydroxyarylamine O-acetyltransferase